MNFLMKRPIAPLTFALLLALVPDAVAQTRRPTTPARQPTRQTQPQPAAQPNPSPVNSTTTTPTTTPIQVVVINGQTLTTSDFDPALRQELETVEQKIAEARRSVLDLQINTMLLEVEAKKRGVDTHRLYQMEVSNRIPTATPVQIKKFIDDNRSQLQLEGVDQAAVNQQVSAYIHDEAENKLADDFVKRLRQSNPVVMGADINSPTLADDAVLATIAGLPLKAGPVKERLKPIIYKIRSEAYSLTKQQADQLI